MTSLRAFNENGDLLWTAEVPDIAPAAAVAVAESISVPAPAPVVAPAPVFFPAWSGREILAGDNGADVQAWQDRLNHLGFTVSTAGTFDLSSVAETQTFQSAQGLDPTGVVDEKTWKAAFHPFSGT